MKPKVWIEKIKFSDDSEVTFDSNQIVVFVGPNNVGKSASLKELNILTRSNHKNGKVIKDFRLQKEGSIDYLVEYLEKFSMKEFSNNPEPHYKGYRFNVYKGNCRSWWSMNNQLLDLQPVFINLIKTEDRLTAANPPKNISLTKDAIQHPIHFLQKDDTIEKQFSDYFRQAFGQDLIVHRNAGDHVPLYIGQKPIPKEGEDRVSRSYLEELEKLPLLHEQGDGMRSFVGVLLNAFISNHNILLIDEPEAFLHPPQARLLGKMLAKDLPTDRQLFLATHSSDFLRGLLEAQVSRLKIIRIEREKHINKISVLDNSEIIEVWNDPLLRHSNILDGLFHSKVIICESDSDCRFYSAILQSIYENESNISPDFLFVHCGGKHRVSSVVKALKQLNVNVNSILDFDVLNNQNPLKQIFEELGGDWSIIEKDWKLVKTKIDEKRPELTTEDVKKELSLILESTTDRIFPKNKIKEVENILKKVSAWQDAKKVGKSFIPNGDPTQAYQRLIVELEQVGLMIVEVGELESFVRSIGNHGPKWVNEVLYKDFANDPELHDAREFVKKLI
ncbi:unknown [Crocosphaera subtropica ATCC 51142]|uniref:AAA+ ATPase domain-containing protein n=1 Tax=Crocosphaera subtropica (strain ATCC 51142 / BH68) TaxID=43989 RepID=B1X1E0_CROS5|nr:AAA family ATPase [Crocosphaera subtropica]ACB51369.1 unknown [Crocosphaera subtropica ATCC 51142]